MSKEQPEAIRLAEILQFSITKDIAAELEAAAELRNLHTENTALRVTEDNLRQELQECQAQRRAAFRRIEELERKSDQDDETIVWQAKEIAGKNDRIAELEQRNSDLYEDVQRFKEHALNEKAARLELERQLEEARKDAERLDYIQKNARSDPKMDGNHVWWPTTFNQAQNLKGPTIRAAIDAAMQKG